MKYLYSRGSYISPTFNLCIAKYALKKRQGNKCLQFHMDKIIESVLHTQLIKQESCLLMVVNTMAGTRGATMDCTEDGRTTRQMNPGFQKRLPHQPRLLHEKQTNHILFKPLLFWVFPLQHPNKFSNISGIHNS